jgi:hypothetical protein
MANNVLKTFIPGRKITPDGPSDYMNIEIETNVGDRYVRVDQLYFSREVLQATLDLFDLIERNTKKEVE